MADAFDRIIESCEKLFVELSKMRSMVAATTEELDEDPGRDVVERGDGVERDALGGEENLDEDEARGLECNGCELARDDADVEAGLVVGGDGSAKETGERLEWLPTALNSKDGVRQVFGEMPKKIDTPLCPLKVEPDHNRLLLPGMQPSSASAASSSARRTPDGPFADLVICVTGLCKEARTQSFAGRKFEHALKHGPRNGLLPVTLGWFVDCVRRNMRLDESLYSIKNIGENGLPLGEFNRLIGVSVSEKSCLPPMIFQDKACSDTTQKHQLQASRKEPDHDVFVFTNDTIYIDPGISGEMRKKISDAATKEGAKLLDHWLIGCHLTYVVCEDAAVKRYVSHSDNIVTPLWILKTVKEKSLQRLVHLSSDLARPNTTTLSSEHHKEICCYLYNRQKIDGGWGLHAEGESSMLSSALNYTALRLLGESVDDGPGMSMPKARKWIHDHGGATMIPIVGKGWLSVLGVSDCTAEALKALLLLSKFSSDVVGDQIETGRLYDAVNILLSLQNPKGGYGTWELARTYPWMEIFNMTSVSLLDKGQSMQAAGSPDECSKACLNNCTCTAYSYGSQGCLVWHVELFNAKPPQSNGTTVSKGEILHLHLAAREMQSSKSHKRSVIIGVVTGACTAVVFVLALMMWVSKTKNSIQGGDGGGIVAFRYTDLRSAPKNFYEQLGEGGFGSVFKGRDFLAGAQTGSGKPTVFCFPIISGIMKSRPPQKPRDSRTAYPIAHILSPTRESSVQIHEEARKFVYQTGDRVVVAYGGAPIQQQLRDLERGVEILVATPGRLMGLLERARVSLQMRKFLALDEADRMLDMGFAPQIHKIVEQMDTTPRGVRQTMLYGATFPKEIQRLTSEVVPLRLLTLRCLVVLHMWTGCLLLLQMWKHHMHRECWDPGGRRTRSTTPAVVVSTAWCHRLGASRISTGGECHGRGPTLDWKWALDVGPIRLSTKTEQQLRERSNNKKSRQFFLLHQFPFLCCFLLLPPKSSPFYPK